MKKMFPIGRDIEIGVMIEVPAAGIVADALAKEARFFQYRHQ